MESPLDDARRRLDTIDHEVLALLAARARITRQLAAWKAAGALPLRDASREAEVLAARRAEAEALGLSPWLAEALARAVFATTRGLLDEDVEAFARGP